MKVCRWLPKLHSCANHLFIICEKLRESEVISPPKLLSCFSMPLSRPSWTIVTPCFMACLNIKFWDYKGYKMLPHDLSLPLQDTTTLVPFSNNSIGFLLLNELSSKSCCRPTRPLKIALHLISRTFCNHTSLLAAFVLHPTIYLKSLATIYSLLVPVPSLLLRPLSGTRYRLNFEMLTQSMFLNPNLKLYFLETPLALSFTVHTYRRIVLDFLL